VITTHYIEEARNADRVGFLRKGRVLDEGKPEDLMRKYSTSTFEGVSCSVCVCIVGCYVCVV
jgi:ABC-type multidrug transport system ATPase subunit